MLLLTKIIRLSVVVTLMLILSGCSVVSVKSPFQQKIPEATEVVPEAWPPQEDSPMIDSLPDQQIVIHPTTAEIREIGKRIYANEAGADKAKLVHWNVNENFASMGISHFTWYPPSRVQTRGNTFPGVIKYLTEHGESPPTWVTLAVTKGAPWYSRQELERVNHTPQVQQLINYLYQTRELQTGYAVERARKGLKRIVNSTPDYHKSRVAGNINVLANTEGGWYPLVDYINFKGEGYDIHGGYKGQNWGMLQVLEQMQPSQPGLQALNAFADAAYIVLARRVKNSPPEKKEARWLLGWGNRVNTYREF